MTRDSASSGRYFFLHIEDNPLDAELAAARLRAGGLNFDHIVVDSRAAFEGALQSTSFDLILADYSLPGFDGLTALKMVREFNARIPFVFVSGVLGEDVAVETLLSGATDYVLKQKMDRLLPSVLRAVTEYDEYRSRQRAEIEVKQGELRFKKLTNILPAMVWASDLEGRLTFTNSLWDRNIGVAASWFDAAILHPSDREKCLMTWHEAQGLHRPFELDCRYRMSNGDYRWHLVWGTPLEGDQGAITGWVGTCTDTEQQRLRDGQARLAEKLALTGRMASVIAHEINNPLEAITNLLYLLHSEVFTEGGRRLLSQTEHELLRISAITKLTLQWSREESTVSLLSAVSLVEETLRLFSGKLRNKSIEIQKQIAEELFFSVIGGEIRQVLANIISNAIDAVGLHGRIIIVIRRVVREGKEFAEIAIQDNGAGIPEDQLPSIFMPFHSTKGDLGNGLGLFISREIIDRHKGNLLVESTFGEGTTMRVHLPLGDSPGNVTER